MKDYKPEVYRCGSADAYEKLVSDLEYQLEQQKIMNPISVNMVATISDLSKQLKDAREIIRLVMPFIEGWEDAYNKSEETSAGKRARDFLSRYPEEDV